MGSANGAPGLSPIHVKGNFESQSAPPSQRALLARGPVQHLELRALAQLIFYLRHPDQRGVVFTTLPEREVACMAELYRGMLPGAAANAAHGRFKICSFAGGGSGTLAEQVLSSRTNLNAVHSAMTDWDVPDKDGRQAQLLPVLRPHVLTEAEASVAVQTGIPLVGLPLGMDDLVGKSGMRKVFRTLGLPLPWGVEDLHSHFEMVRALKRLPSRSADNNAAIFKLNDGVAGYGGATTSTARLRDLHGRARWGEARRLMGELTTAAPGLSRRDYVRLVTRHGAVLEQYVGNGDDEVDPSPSVLLHYDPAVGQVEIDATFEQWLGGTGNASCIGSRYPARESVRPALHSGALAIGGWLRDVAAEFGYHGYWGAGADARAVRRGVQPERHDLFWLELNGRRTLNSGPLWAYKDLVGRPPDAMVTTDNVDTQLLGNGRSLRGVPTERLAEAFAASNLLLSPESGQGILPYKLTAAKDYGQAGLAAYGSNQTEVDEIFAQGLNIYRRIAGDAPRHFRHSLSRGRSSPLSPFAPTPIR